MAALDYRFWSAEDWVTHYGGPHLADQYTTGVRLLYPWNDDIPQAKIRVDGKYKSVLADVQSCAALSAPEKLSFRTQYDAWRRFYCGGANLNCPKPDWSYFALGTQMDEIEAWEARLFDWQQKIQGRCTLSAPVVKPKAEGDPDHWEKTTKYVAIAAGVIAAAYMLGPAARSLGSRAK